MSTDFEMIVKKQSEFIKYYINENKKLKKEINDLNNKIEDLNFQLQNKKCMDMVNNKRRK